ncbi:MAG TPA: TlpA disulfide reductase family protein [Verrucomicrobiae bacterium]|nr:TlpA disulfide reductase family protein [Verrucomicrobiae bacterium]
MWGRLATCGGWAIRLPAPALLFFLFAGPALLAQVSDEQKELNAALAEAGASPIEYLRAIEQHLERYPDSPRRPELERAAARAAIEAHRAPETILWGERVLSRQGDDLPILDAVAQALIEGGTPDGATRALRYARRLQELDRARNAADGIAHGLVLEARADQVLGHSQEALDIGRRAFAAHPSAEAAREIAGAAERLGKINDAILALADAFTISDPRATDADRARDRAQMGKLYRQLHGSETGLGDLVLHAYDRNQALLHPANADPMAVTLEALDGHKLSLASLKDKVVVLDFWATWCIPCREEHPLLQQVRDHFHDNPAVTFLSINADEDRTRVKTFLAKQHWTEEVFFAAGLDRAMNVKTFPATIVLDAHGHVFSYLAGFVPERFVDTLSGRIQAALEAR